MNVEEIKKIKDIKLCGLNKDIKNRTQIVFNSIGGGVLIIDLDPHLCDIVRRE